MNDQNSFDIATRIAAGDDKTDYDNVAVSLHWATALLVFIQFALSETWDWFARGTHKEMQSVHVSLGILLTFVVVARLVWRWIPGHQRSSLEAGWMLFASKTVHYLFYILLIVQAGLGWVIGWADGHPIHFFGIPIPGPFAAISRSLRHDLREIHSTVGWTIIILAFGHALAALYHHYMLHDRVLSRMYPPSRRRSEAA